jgi:PhnB protein
MRKKAKLSLSRFTFFDFYIFDFLIFSMQLIPYIMFNGTCEAALQFYAKALKGNIENMSRYGDTPGCEELAADPKMIMHGIMTAGSFSIMGSDAGKNDKKFEGDNVQLSLGFDTAEEQQQVFEALSEGATITMPLQDTFWGATFGMLTDKFGIRWMFNYDKK